jgi:hypothetical protein
MFTPVARVHLPLKSADANYARIAMPYEKGTRRWLRNLCGSRAHVEWDKPSGKWVITRSHFRKVVEALSNRYGLVKVTQEFTDKVVCTASCQSAQSTPDNCECSCGGDQHGGGFPADWENAEIFVSYDRIIRTFIVHANAPVPA